jgi:hypothetical protein
MELEVMPKQINVMWVATYGVDEVIQTLKEDNRVINGEEMTFTLDDVILYIENETLDMMRNARARDLIFQDQNGDTLDDY